MSYTENLVYILTSNTLFLIASSKFNSYNVLSSRKVLPPPTKKACACSTVNNKLFDLWMLFISSPAKANVED